MKADIKQGRKIIKYKKGETPKIYVSSLTCFDTLSYTYDENSIRTSKTVNGETSTGHQFQKA